MSRVRVEPGGIDLDLRDGETIMDGANRVGYSWPTVCGGQGNCKVCTLEVQEGSDQLSLLSRFERQELERSFGGLDRGSRPLRLACQATAFGPAVVFKRGVRKRAVAPDASGEQ